MRIRGWKLAYGVGHFLNDVCATVWFSYTLLFFQRVLCFPSSLAGIVVLTGQVADGVSTVFVGLMADKDLQWAICRYGKRKLWHLLGTVCVIVTFPFIFNKCVGCDDAPKDVQLYYFVAFVIIFQFGWAAVQISHLSLIPSLTKNQRERTELNALRYGFTVTANILVYTVAWVVLGTAATADADGGDPAADAANGTAVGNSTSGDGGVGPSDAPQFRLIVLSTMAVGIVTTVVFHIFTKEPASTPPPPPAVQRSSTCPVPAGAAPGARPEPATVGEWLKRTEFWMLSVIYMSVRLYVNLSMTYITLYLHDYLHAPKTSVAVFPLIMYIGGFFGSLGIKLLNHQLGRRISLGIGALLGIVSCLGIFFGEGEVYSSYLVYGVAVLLGMGGSIMLVTTLAATSDIIGTSVKGAFVYGALSFCDKLSNGAVVEIIQNIMSCTAENEKECGELYKYVLVVMCGGTSVVVLLIILFYRSTKLWHPREEKHRTTSRLSLTPSTRKFSEAAVSQARSSVCSRRESVIPEGVLFDGPLPALDLHDTPPDEDGCCDNPVMENPAGVGAEQHM
ncbi:major facilitator superfamily domain-containing protein 12-like isoform X3 [Amphibalanus amphitrite]|nr:major facilitator superfamily domain-containing protein 12-like isoform X3 [Amphibalanus amphitrite]XP_043197383.1 major facilitator superfamily domain-containing protein 12-like isoform X3 [Amphibalanus amphitrite]XP_043197384.1 major facilitator superfamily domain-containing protein 12-like isoform X3 [Amphibalanus amphitrite]